MCSTRCSTRCNDWLVVLGFLLIQVTCQGAESVDEFTNAVGMKLKLIPAGEFMMGSKKTTLELLPIVTIYAGLDPETERPQHRVRITQPYFVSVTEVTQGQWERVMGSRPWTTRPNAKGETISKVRSRANFGERWGPDYPAIWVSWEEAQEFCKLLSRKDDGKFRYRLPTEAEWEYACRAKTTTTFSFGDTPAKLQDFAWFNENAYRQKGEEYAHEVARRKSNDWGLYDMHGNVSEWCQDWYAADYYATSPVNDPMGPSEGTKRVVKGGGWHDGDANCRSSSRLGLDPTHSRRALGFRVVAERADGEKSD